MSQFVKTPHALLFDYPFVNKYKAEYTVLYNYIVHYYNEKEGYAWPNVDTLALYYGKSVKTTSQHLQALYELGLIERTKVGMKYQYKPIQPLEGSAFYERFPEATINKQSRIKERDRERERAASNMARKRERAN